MEEGETFTKPLRFSPSPLASTWSVKPWVFRQVPLLKKRRAEIRLRWARVPRGFPTLSVRWKRCLLPPGLRSSLSREVLAELKGTQDFTLQRKQSVQAGLLGLLPCW